MRLARAADRAGTDRVEVDGEPESREPLVYLLDVLGCDTGDDEVLLPRDADVAAVLLGEPGEGDHLRPAQQPDVNRDADRPEAVVLQPDAPRRRWLPLPLEAEWTREGIRYGGAPLDGDRGR